MEQMIPSDFTIPGPNRTALSDELAAEIHSRHDAIRRDRFHLFLLAAGIRSQYLDTTSGDYKEEFTEWYGKHKIGEVIGSLANFTKYAAAGDVIQYVSTKSSDPEKYLARLPVSLTALYEISYILKEDPTLITLCMNHYPTRRYVGQPKSEWGYHKEGARVIAPDSTEEHIRRWRLLWFHPPKRSSAGSELRTVPVAQIYVHKTLFAFDRKTGKAISAVGLTEVEQTIQKLISVVGSDNEWFRIVDDLEPITRKYQTSQKRADPAWAVLKKSKKKASKKKASKKKASKKASKKVTKKASTKKARPKKASTAKKVTKKASTKKARPKSSSTSKKVARKS